MFEITLSNLRQHLLYMESRLEPADGRRLGSLCPEVAVRLGTTLPCHPPNIDVGS